MANLGLLLELKWTTVRNAFRSLHKRSRLEFATLVLFFIAAAVALFLFFHYSFHFFRSQEPFGRILMDETFYLFTFALFFMLLVSSAVSSYASLYRSGEVAFLVVQPVRWEEVYFIKWVEALWYSSWSCLFIVIPFMAAYGLNKGVAMIWFPLLCFLFFIPFVILAGMLGSLLATLTVWLLPTRTYRHIALLLGIGISIYVFIQTEPELIKEQGSIAGIMSGYLPHVAFAKNPLLPSSWVTKGILALSEGNPNGMMIRQEGIFYFLVLLSNMLFFIIPSYSAAAGLFPKTYLGTGDYAGIPMPKRVGIRTGLEKILDALPWPPPPALAFVEKDLKTFARDPAEWSQMIIFFGLLLLYFMNLKNLEFHVLKDFWKNLVFVLNTVGTYIVLSSFSMRFVFPMLSLEGSRFWIICLAPIRYSSLLLEKFLLGTIASAILTMPLVFLSGSMLEIPFERVLFTTGLGFFVCVALTGLSVGLGAKFPNFKSTNPSQIISGFGGSLLLVIHLCYLALIGVFLMANNLSQMFVFITIAAGSLLVGTLPLKLGVNALKRMEF